MACTCPELSEPATRKVPLKSSGPIDGERLRSLSSHRRSIPSKCLWLGIMPLNVSLEDIIISFVNKKELSEKPKEHLLARSCELRAASCGLRAANLEQPAFCEKEMMWQFEGHLFLWPNQQNSCVLACVFLG